MIKENTDRTITERDTIKIYNKMKSSKAITLISLVITIIVLLILARSKYINSNWGQWNINKN